MIGDRSVLTAAVKHRKPDLNQKKGSSVTGLATQLQLPQTKPENHYMFNLQIY